MDALRSDIYAMNQPEIDKSKISNFEKVSWKYDKKVCNK